MVEYDGSGVYNDFTVVGFGVEYFTLEYGVVDVE